ncbi:MAG: T9SS type A sorting domain-containing protein [Bacteroidetes bacterium]|nr:T9SS type A sorting domain-containing protein [Bacteroidota bacterium]
MKKITIFILLFSVYFLSNSQTIRFNRMYNYTGLLGGIGNRFNQIVIKNKQYITFGHYAPYIQGLPNGFISIMATKHDSLGNLLNWIPYLDTAYNYGLSSWNADVKCKDGGYIISGAACENHSPYAYYGFLIKLDSNLNMQWKRLYSDTTALSTWIYKDYGFQSLKVTPDNGYIAVGCRYKNSGLACGLAVKFDSLGNKQWEKTYNQNYYFSPLFSVIILPDGYAFAGGLCTSSDNNSVDVSVIKTDTTGNIIWQKIMGGTKGDETISLQNYPDGNIMAFFTKCDSAYSSQGSYFNFLKPQFYKLSAVNGDSLWSLSYNSVQWNNISFSFRVFPDGTALASGFYNYYQTPWLLHLNTEGDIDWYKEYSMLSNQNNFMAQIFDLNQTEDKGFVICGQLDNFDTIHANCGWIMKLDKHGCLVPNCDSIVSINENIKVQSSMEIYPNPATSEITVTYFSDLDKPVLEIYNILGVKVMDQTLPKSCTSFKLNIDKLSIGYYKVILKDKGFIRGQVPLIVGKM